MITMNLSHKNINEVEAQGYVFFCAHNGPLTADQKAWSSSFFPHAAEVLQQSGFNGGVSASQVITGVHNGKPVHLMFIGLGSTSCTQSDRREHLRRALGTTIRTAERFKISSLAMPLLHAADFDMDECELAQEIMTTLEMSIYHFDQFITDEKRHLADEYAIALCAPGANHEALQVGIKLGTHIGHAVNQARHWCDLPPCVLTPAHFADQAMKVAQGHYRLTCKVLTGLECRDIGMGGLQAVSQGSENEARFVIMEYKSGHNPKETVALVGKGVTFDSGGISIKPASGMEDMKDDMAGAAAVISTMQAIAHFDLPVNVIGVAPLVENMPSGTAFRPGDIVGHYNGLTSEVKNTDAEGRLILADALSYVAKHYTPDAIIDVATLTGSCSHALGSFFAGLMSKYDEFTHRLIETGNRSGDWLWRLPFHDDYKVAVRSDVADVCNIGKSQYKAGAITAGFFLEHFVDKKTPWIHLDIAGTSYNIPDRSYLRPGASGFGVRLFFDLLMNWKPLTQK